MSQKSQSEPGGNTKTPGLKTAQATVSIPKNQMYRWFFTLKMEECTVSQLSQLLKGISKEFTFSGEIGAGGYRHWQGCFSLKQKEYFATCKNHFPNSIHLEPCKNWFSSVNYCKKEETHICGPFDENSTFIEDPMEGLKYYPWQEEIISMIAKKPERRKIYWYWESMGGVGKSDFATHLCLLRDDVIVVSGAAKDIQYAITTMKKAPKVVIFDIPMDKEGYVSYSGMEEIKNGRFFTTKYESKMFLMNVPHVIVFANFAPESGHCAADRWVTKNIRNESEIDEDI